MPAAVPTKMTLAPWAASASASARPGNRWPPVPPPAMRILIWGPVRCSRGYRRALLLRCPQTPSAKTSAPALGLRRHCLSPRLFGSSPALAGQGEEDADLAERGNHGRAAVGEERQGQPLGREAAEHYARVHHALEDERERHAEGEQAREPILMSDGDAEATRRHHREAREDDERPGQPELLADHREEEVGVRLGEVEHLLPALAEPHTPQAPRAEGDERLLELEVDAEGIAVGVKEGDDARPAIGRLPRHGGERRERRQRRERHQAGRYPAHEE